MVRIGVMGMGRAQSLFGTFSSEDMASLTPLESRPALMLAGVLFAVSFLCAWATFSLSQSAGTGLSLWLPTGLVMATALVTPLRQWPLWAGAGAAAELIGNILWYHHALGPALLFISGNLASAFAGAIILRSVIGNRYMLATVRDATAFLCVVLAVMPIISATIVSTALGWSYGASPFDAWTRIYLGDAAGTVIGAPLALLVYGHAARRPRITPRALMEIGVLLVLFACLAFVSLGGVLPFVFLMLIPIIWASLRFRAYGAISAAALLAVFASTLTAVGMSPFGAGNVFGQYGLQGLQLFMMVVSGCALVVGAIAEEYRAIIRELSSSNRVLAARDIEQAQALVQSRAKARETADLLAAIGEACPDLIFAKNLDHNMIYANTATLDVLGRGHDLSLHTFDPHTGLRDEQAAVVHSNDERVIATGETISAEEVIATPIGDRTFRVTKAPLRDADGKISGIAGVGVDITEQKAAAEREKLLTHEIEHRSRNLLAVLQSIVQLTQGDSVDDLRQRITARLQAVARTNSIIAASEWKGARLHALIRDEIATYWGEDDLRLTLTGIDVLLESRAAQSVALVIHELATNAAKYGAISTATGRLAIETRCDADNGNALHILWQESGGPEVRKPERTGFGSTVIRLMIEDYPEGSVEFDWDPAGLRVNISIPAGSEVVIAAA